MACIIYLELNTMTLSCRTNIKYLAFILRSLEEKIDAQNSDELDANFRVWRMNLFLYFSGNKSKCFRKQWKGVSS